MKNSPKAMEEDRALKDVFSYIDDNKQLSKAWKKRFPTWFWGKIPFTELGWEVILFWKIRQFKDGISFFEFNVTVDLYDPLEYAKFYYRPHFRIHLVVFNYTLIELDLYKRMEKLQKHKETMMQIRSNQGWSSKEEAMEQCKKVQKQG